MAKPLLERLQLDLKPTGRISDCKRDLVEAEAERAQIEERIADCERRSEDPATPDDEARVALQQAADWRFHAKRLDRAIADVRAAIAAKEADESHLERRKQFDAARTARDALVERWKALGVVWDELVALFGDTVANDRLLAQVNLHRSRGEPALRSAELEARGALNDSYWPNSIGHAGEPFQRLTAMEWPALFGPGFAWSQRDAEMRKIAAATARDGARHAAAMSAHAAANTPEALAETAEAEAERFKRYKLSPVRYGGAGRVRVHHRGGVAGIGAEPACLWLDDGQVEEAKSAGLNVQLASDKDDPEPQYLRNLGGVPVEHV